MALTPSTMLPLGTAAPDFRLPDVVSGKTISLSTCAGKKALLVMFICRQCPYVVHVREELARMWRYMTENSLYDFFGNLEELRCLFYGVTPLGQQLQRPGGLRGIEVRPLGVRLNVHRTAKAVLLGAFDDVVDDGAHGAFFLRFPR